MVKNLKQHIKRNILTQTLQTQPYTTQCSNKIFKHKCDEKNLTKHNTTMMSLEVFVKNTWYPKTLQQLNTHQVPQILNKVIILNNNNAILYLTSPFNTPDL